MKNIFLVLSFLTITLSSFASTPPEKVKKAFELKFPTATLVKWIKETKHEYEAAFTVNGVKHSANFLDSGEWLETESPITFNTLPKKVQDEFNTAHKNVKIKAIAKIDNSKGETQYEIEVKNGLKTVEYFYSSEGKLIK